MAAHGQDPNRIDVSLNIMSDATLTAVNQLTDQLTSLREFLASQAQAGNPAAQAESAGRWTPQSGGLAWTRPGETQAGIFHGPSRPIQQGDPANPTDGSQRSAARRKELEAEYKAYEESVKQGTVPHSPEGPPISPDAESMMAHRMSDWQRWRHAGREAKDPNLPTVTSRMNRFFELYPGASRDPQEDRAYEDESQVPRRGGSALPEGMGYPRQGPPTTSPMAQYGDMPGWAQALGKEGITPESRLALTIPRLGEFTIQDKLNMAAQWMGRAAMRHEGPDDTNPRFTQAVGRTAASAAYLRDQSASIVALQREWQRVHAFARGEEQSGEALGFSREAFTGDIEALGIGYRPGLPWFSEASREAMHQELTQRRVQAAAGVSGEEAQAIRQTVAGMGYSGSRNERLQMDLFRPLQQRGIGAEQVAPLVDQGVRQGNMSIVALRDTMIDLADAARDANMTLEDTTAAALEYSESVQEIGANYEASLRNAATFTRSGLDPRIAGQAMQSPMMQGILSMQTGLPPQLQGIIGAPGVMRGMGQAIRQGLDLGAPFANLPDSTIRSASGQKITVATGKDAQVAMAQQMTGIPRQIIERYMDNPNFLEAGGLAQTMAGQMQDQVRGMTHRERTVTETRSVPKSNLQRDIGRTRIERITRTEAQKRGLTDADRRRLEKGSTTDSVVSYDELERQMIEMDPKNRKWTDRVKKISKDHGKVEDRLNVAQRIIGEATNVKPEPDYLVGLTAEARKILKIEKPKDRSGAVPRANAGGAPANGAMLGPNFGSSTGGAMQYGSPGGP